MTKIKHASMLLYESAMCDPAPADWALDFKNLLAGAAKENFRNQMKNIGVVEAFREGTFDLRKINMATETLNQATVKSQMAKFMSFGPSPGSENFFDGMQSSLREYGLNRPEDRFIHGNVKKSITAYIEAIKSLRVVVQEITTMAKDMGSTQLYTRLQNALDNEVSVHLLSEIEKVLESYDMDDLQKKVLSENVVDPEWDSLFSDKNNYDNFINEGVVDNVKDKVNDGGQEFKRRLEWFDNVITRKVEKIKEAEKQDRERFVITGSISTSREILRALKTLPFNLIHPGLGYLLYCASLIFTYRSTKEQRSAAIADIKTAEKLVEEMMTHADADGDRKAKLKLIQEKDRLQRNRELLEKKL